MEYEYPYKDLVERQEKVTEVEGLGYRMLHDNFDSDWKPGDEPHGVMIFTDVMEPTPILEPPLSTHFARVTAFDPTAETPITVVRTWQGLDYSYDCYVTQDIVDAFVAGKLAIGDYVLVHYDDSDRQIAMMKIYKTW